MTSDEQVKSEETQMAAANIDEPIINGTNPDNGSNIKVEENPKLVDADNADTNNVEEEEKEEEQHDTKSDEKVLCAGEKEEEEEAAKDCKDGNENGKEEVVQSTTINKEEEEQVEEIKETSSSDLKDNEKKALIDFKSKLEEAILQNKLFPLAAHTKEEKEKEEEAQKEKEPQTKPATQEGNDEDDKLEKSKQEEEKVVEEKEKTVQEEGKAVEEKEKSLQEEEKVGEEKEKSVDVVAELEEEDTADNKEKCTPKEEEEKKAENQENEEDKKKSDDDVVVVDKDISLWGVPLLPSAGSEATDVILLKFLRARDFKVNEAFEMLKNTLQWRKDNKIDSILDEDLGLDHLNSVAYMDGIDHEGHPICYNMYGIFENDELYQKTFGTEEQRQLFMRWRFQLMEKGIQKLDFSNKKGVSSLLQINDLKNSPGPSRKELRIAMKQAVGLLQDNYPEFVARNIFVNVPFWYYAFNAVLSPFLTQRTKSKFVFARPAKVTETLLRYIPAQQIPIRYGGMKRENDSEFSSAAEECNVTEVIVKSGSTEAIEIPAPESGVTLLWDLIVLGWEVNYKEEFVPSDEGSYTMIIQKGKKMGSQEESIRNSFRNSEPGKVVLTVENNTFKKKKVLYRYKTKMISA
ncbi:patellin-4-like [Papaver somniferum]|uniref:patellin-4-like n=1 Tax=Papaver somniferum TaxID=3469 RepID=UPI000E6F9B82|nr:patellin-4-like [Papaver somniferum]